MISNCPHCQGALKFSDAQKAKIGQALKGLKPGQKLPLKCPHCKKPIQLDANGEAGGGAAKTEAAKKAPAKAPEAEGGVKPPPPPSADWMNEEQSGLMESVRDVPMALVLHSGDGERHQIVSSMEALGYQVMTIKTAQEAKEQVGSGTFACIVYHVSFEGGTLEESTFHNYMRDMPMTRRRYIFYILMGPQFTSLYDIEALANSANLVVSDKDLKNFQLVLHKAIPYYEQLFGPLLEEMGAYGKA